MICKQVYNQLFILFHVSMAKTVLTQFQKIVSKILLHEIIVILPQIHKCIQYLRVNVMK